MWLAVARLPVILQSNGADEIIFAAAARVNRIVHCFIVQLEVGRIFEPLPTDVASVRLLRVSPEVAPQVGKLRESLLANSAVVRLLTSMS